MSDSTFTTTDLSFSAFIMTIGQIDTSVKTSLIKTKNISQYKQENTFDDPEKQYDDLCTRWLNSDFRLYDGNVRDLKKRLH